MTQEQLNKLSTGSYLKFSFADCCVQETIEARKLLCTARFDIYAILVYIDHKIKGVKNLSWAKEVYRERTGAMTGNKWSENGNEDKNSFEDFICVLDQLIDDFNNNHFDKERTLIPVDKDYIPMDGAHRVACAAYFGTKINILRFPDREYQFKGYQYLKHELLPTRISDYMALESIRWHEDLFVYFLWPQAHLNNEKLKKAQDIIYDNLDVLYDVEYKLSYIAIRNLMIQIYGHMEWLGNIDNDFVNVIKKVDEVWASNGLVQIIVTRCNSCETITYLKTQIREMFGIGLSSCHSTDNQRETKLALNILLNPLSRHFLEQAKPTLFKESFKRIVFFKEIIKKNGLSLDNFIVDSSTVLAIYGLRDARDLDYYCLPNNYLKSDMCPNVVEEHDNTQKEYYAYPIQDYIISPEHYFVFNEVKFISLADLLIFKSNRYAQTREAKDSIDIELIKSIVKNDNIVSKSMLSLKYYILRKRRAVHDYFYALFYWRRKEILEKIGLYKPLKALKTYYERHKD